jgi:hypothetical protein
MVAGAQSFVNTALAAGHLLRRTGAGWLVATGFLLYAAAGFRVRYGFHVAWLLPDDPALPDTDGQSERERRT